MVKIVHYDVYVDYGKGWVLYERLPSEQRDAAYSIIKSTETSNIPVKIVKEAFDVKDGTFTESVEYVSGLAIKSKKLALKKRKLEAVGLEDNLVEAEEDKPEKDNDDRGQMFIAVVKLFIMIAIGLLATNIILTLIYPIIEMFIPEKNLKASMFFIFFILFLLITIPLLLKHVPWEVFVLKAKSEKPKIKEKEVFEKALDIVSIYSFNSDNPNPIAPVAESVSVEHKNDVIDFLSSVLSSLEDFEVKDDFSRLGMKLLAYGGAMELARYNGLSLPKANALLYEIFRVIDGDKQVDLEKFYEAKRTYKDSNIAVFLTGVGAHWMQSLINKKPVNKALINKTFQKWSELRNTDVSNDYDQVISQNVKDILFDCIVSIKSMIRFEDNHDPKGEAEKRIIEGTREDIRNIIFNLVKKYEGENVVENGGIASIKFTKLNYAARFAIELLRNIDMYQESANKTGLVFYNTCNIVKFSDYEYIDRYIDDIFEHNYNDEIVVTNEIYERFEPDAYDFEYLGEKRLENVDKDVELYRLNY